jgi:hypothetical protein
MTSELRPAPLAEAARQLDIDPFELVRLMVAAGQRPQLLELTGIDLVRIAEFAGIERWWDEEGDAPEDANPKRARVRTAIGALLSRRFVGTRRTRRDNLWRGRPRHDREVIEEAVEALVEQGLLETEPHVRGIRISAAEDAVSKLERFVEGAEPIDALQQLWN